MGASMLNAKKMRDPVIWQTDLDTLMERISDHYLVDEDAFVSESRLSTLSHTTYSVL